MAITFARGLRAISLSNLKSLLPPSSSSFSTFRISCDPDIPGSEEYPFVSQGCKNPMFCEQDDKAFYARIDLPGAERKGLRVWVKNNEIHFEAEEVKGNESIFNKDTARKYKGHVPLYPGLKYQTDGIKAVISEGVLQVMVPKAAA